MAELAIEGDPQAAERLEAPRWPTLDEEFEKAFAEYHDAQSLRHSGHPGCHSQDREESRRIDDCVRLKGDEVGHR